MDTYHLAQRLYWRLLPVPVLGRRLRATVDGVKASVRRVAAPTLDSVHETLQVHTIALAGLRDLIARLQDDTSQQTRQFLGVVEGLRVALESERHSRESIQCEVRGQLEDTRARLGELRAEGGRLRERMEFIREETMFELRVVANTAANRASAPPIPGEIVNSAKYEAMAAAGTVRLNVGCGHVTHEEYLNVDRRRLPGVDVVAEAIGLPFPPESVVEIYASHLLEHFPLEQLQRVVLPHWLSLLKPGGTFRVVVPDAEGMIASYAKDEMSFVELREVTFGLQEYDGDFHFNMFSRESLKTLLEQAGLADLHYTFTGRRNGRCLDMEMRGTRAAR